MHACVRICVSVYVCVREREGERGELFKSIPPNPSLYKNDYAKKEESAPYEPALGSPKTVCLNPIFPESSTA